MSEDIPTTEEIRKEFCYDERNPVNNLGDTFDRWLEQHDAEVAKATEERIIDLIKELGLEGYYHPVFQQYLIGLIKPEPEITPEQSQINAIFKKASRKIAELANDSVWLGSDWDTRSRTIDLIMGQARADADAIREGENK